MVSMQEQVTPMTPGLDSGFHAEFIQDVIAEAHRLNAKAITLDLFFYVFLRRLSRFGFFSFGPINIDVRLIEDIVEATIPRAPGPLETATPMAPDIVPFSNLLMAELNRSGRGRLDELHFLLAFMRCNEGLPGRVFGELGVTPEQVEQFASNLSAPAPAPMLEELYSPEEAAAYLNVHVQTVRAWIRSGRLRARRLAGQRALRITASDLQSVLEPLDPAELDAGA
jgi:excisionase family DNA binding protein